MPRLLLFTTILLTLITPVFAEAQMKASKPNVILFFSDDQGTLDVGCYGAKDLHTPNLDRLAKEGIRFKQFYVAAPVCSPSRAGLLTGRFPKRAGVPGNVSSRPGNQGLPSAEVTIAEMLKRAGYVTALIGKWHLGTANDSDPLAQGFDYFFGHKAGCIDNYSHYFYWQGPPYHDLWRNRDEVREDGKYFTSLVVREAKSFIEKHKNQPFFLYVPFNIPHYPLQAPAEMQKRYEHLPEPRRAYAAMIAALDHAVGEIVDCVDDQGIRENTLILFLSDHGHSTEERNNFGGGFSGPFRGNKFTLFEGGLRVPCIISWKGKLPENETRNQPTISLDIFPTIAEVCGAKLPNRKIDGRSLLPLLKSDQAKSTHEVFYWQVGKQWAVREGNWKLLFNAQGDGKQGNAKKVPQIFLVNLENDPAEEKNLAKENPAIVERLQRLHQEWVADVNRKE